MVTASVKPVILLSGLVHIKALVLPGGVEGFPPPLTEVEDLVVLHGLAGLHLHPDIKTKLIVGDSPFVSKAYLHMGQGCICGQGTQVYVCMHSCMYTRRTHTRTHAYTHTHIHTLTYRYIFTSNPWFLSGMLWNEK